ncbi:MAG: poly-gamma-glutamate biosynthesis protein PgsC [Bacteroidetes bacterium]|nr:poly-gamma-glutamate biosynthesis protein PgsC [Bacteroidota bacterium]
MLQEIFFVGLVIGFIYYEIFGISPGGVIAPAYFVLYIDQPFKIVITILISLIVWYLIKLLSDHFIVFGRRRLLIALLLGFTLKVIIMGFIQPIAAFNFDLQSIGYIIPGLIANEYGRQGILPTVSSIGIVMVLTYLVVVII